MLKLELKINGSNSFEKFNYKMYVIVVFLVFVQIFYDVFIIEFKFNCCMYVYKYVKLSVYF